MKTLRPYWGRARTIRVPTRPGLVRPPQPRPIGACPSSGWFKKEGTIFSEIIAVKNTISRRTATPAPYPTSNLGLPDQADHPPALQGWYVSFVWRKHSGYSENRSGIHSIKEGCEWFPARAHGLIPKAGTAVFKILKKKNIRRILAMIEGRTPRCPCVEKGLLLERAAGSLYLAPQNLSVTRTRSRTGAN